MSHLNCWVSRDDIQRVFDIEIASEQTVGTLKEAIKEQKARLFDDIDPDSLHLWLV
ncbi:uncharacterized protein EDB91DRAFT_1011775, partial [Suillus paluster]|uniref:uncharacterized protein n=1 Tax=Suillus paluster TaxID=48578 RepID=UPI001B85DFD8